VIPVELTKSIDAKKVKPGDEVVARVTEDMKTNSGMVLVPKDTKVVGHVTEAQPRSKAGAANPSSMGGGRSGGTGATTPSPSTPAPNMPSTSGTSADGQSGTATNGAISAKTQGVVGISNLKLTASADSTQGSLLISEKNNVKLESGTFMLLRVN
jgi:hypothetical protein